MTNLEKPVHRKTRGAYSILYTRPEKIVVSLLPGDLLQFRNAGRRVKFTIPVDSVMRYAVRLESTRKMIEKQKARKARRGKV